MRGGSQVSGGHYVKEVVALGPAVAVFGKWKGADALAGGGEDCVAYGGENRRQSGFTKTSRRMVGRHQMNFDFRGRLRHTNWGIRVEIVLYRAALFDGDFVGHQRTQTFDHRALALIFGVERIDDLAANIADDPYLIYFHSFGGIDVDVGDRGKIAAMRKIASRAHRRSFGKIFARSPL